MATRELRNPKRITFIANARLGTRSAKRPARGNEHAQPAAIIGVVFGPLSFEFQACMLEVSQGGPGRRRKLVIVIEEPSVHSESNRTHAVPIVDAQQIVRFEEMPFLSTFDAGKLGFPATHENTPPAVRTRVKEDAKILSIFRWILGPPIKGQRGIELSPCARGQPRFVIFEGEDLFATGGRRRKLAHQDGAPKPCPVGGDLDDSLLAHASRAFFAPSSRTLRTLDRTAARRKLRVLKLATQLVVAREERKIVMKTQTVEHVDVRGEADTWRPALDGPQRRARHAGPLRNDFHRKTPPKPSES